MVEAGLIIYALRDVDHGVADSVRLSAADHIEALERQIAELRAKVDVQRQSKEYAQRCCEAAEAENARSSEALAEIQAIAMLAEGSATLSAIGRIARAALSGSGTQPALPLKEEVERPDFWAVQSKTGMHIGLWTDRADADEAMHEYEGGTIMPLFRSSILSRLRAGEQEGWRELPLPDPTSHASMAPGPANCSIRKRCQGEAYPRTCERCGLGPCPFFHGNGEANRLPAAPSGQGGERS